MSRAERKRAQAGAHARHLAKPGSKPNNKPAGHLASRHARPNADETRPYSADLMAELYDDRFAGLDIIPTEKKDELEDKSADDEAPLSSNEVAAVSEDREFYVSDVETPYLSAHIAHEDIAKTKRRQSVITTICVTLVLICVAAGVGWFILSNMPKEETKDVTKYETESIEYGTFTSTYTKKVHAKPNDVQEVKSTASGTVTQVNVEKGKTVSQGDVLYKLFNNAVNRELNSTRRALESAQKLADAKASDLDAARDNVDRINAELQQLSAQGDEEVVIEEITEVGSTSTSSTEARMRSLETELTNATNAVESANEDYEQALSKLDTAQSNYDSAVSRDDKLLIRAPIGGMLTDVNEKIQKASKVTSSTQLCTIYDTSVLTLELPISKDDKPYVREGSEVTITFPKIGGLKLKEPVASITENEDGSATATVSLTDYDERIVPNITAKATMTLQSIPESFIVPNEAVITEKDGKTYLNVLIDASRGIVTKVRVKVVAKNKRQSAVFASDIQRSMSVVIGEVEDADQK